MKSLYLLMLLGLIGCGNPPAPPTTHWGGYLSIGETLYCSDGHEAASAIQGQACVQTSTESCQYFETHTQAVRYIVEHTKCPAPYNLSR